MAQPNFVEPVLRPAKPTETDSVKRENSVPVTDPQQKKKRKIETVAVGRKPAAQLEKWATKRQELKGEKTQSQPPALPPPQPPQSQLTTATAATGLDQGVSQFADLTQMCCLLCKRKFQTIEEIQKHERISKLHQVPSLAFFGDFRYTDIRLILPTIRSAMHV